MKICKQCKFEKENFDFYKHKGTNDGLSCYCKICDKDRQRILREKNRLKVFAVKDKLKKCSQCKEKKEVSGFHRNRCTGDGLDGVCKVCRNSRYSNNRDRNLNEGGADNGSPSRRCHLKRTYNMPLEEYNERLRRQNNLCAICSKPETMKKRGRLSNLSVDHDHVTGENRGLLCDGCNKLLGVAKDDPEILDEAAKYLRRHPHGGDPRNAGSNRGFDTTRSSDVAG